MNPTQKSVARLLRRVRAATHAFDNRRRADQAVPAYVLFLVQGPLPELPPNRTEWWMRFLPQREPSLQDLAAHFDQVARDPRVRGVVLHLRPLPMPLAHLQTLRDDIGRLRAAGKHVVAWATDLDTATYYVACAADEILLQPGGGIAPLGLNREYLFLADTLDKAGLAADAVQITPYKSGAEMFTRRDMSEESRAMAEWLTEDAWEDLLRGIADGRNLTWDEARALVDHTPLTDLQARDVGAVDGLLHEEALPAYLGTSDAPARLEMWETAQKLLLHPPLPQGEQVVGLLRIEGAIMPGKSRQPPFRTPLPIPIFQEAASGDLTVVQAARAALVDEQIAAVVLFIESPGGAVNASEAMAAALEQLAAHKPLVAVMGSVAASGGYYVATPARWIVAQPGTITGSIGVFFMKGLTGGLLDKLAIGREKITRGRFATLFDADHPFTDEERAKLWESVQRIYDLFVERVGRSRGMTADAVDAVGGGRVWTGRQALAHGLVDELGGLAEATAKARSLAGLPEDAPLREIFPPRKPLAPKG